MPTGVLNLSLWCRRIVHTAVRLMLIIRRTTLRTRLTIISRRTIQRNTCSGELFLEVESNLCALSNISLPSRHNRKQMIRTAPKYPPPGPPNSISVAKAPYDANCGQTWAVGSGSCRPSTGRRQRQYFPGVSPKSGTSGSGSLKPPCGRAKARGRSLRQHD